MRWPRRRLWPLPIRASSRSSSARRTRTWQCVRGDRVVQLDRRTRELRNESAVRQKFGAPPVSIPDWLALVGDRANGYPGLPGWGAKSAATVLAHYQHLPALAGALGVITFLCCLAITPLLCSDP